MPYNPIKLCFSPTDPRWTGVQRMYFPLLLAKIVVFVALLILCIIEAVLFKNWTDSYWSRSDSTEYAYFWIRWAGILIVPEGIHIITQVVALAYNAYHPITAITTSCVFFCLWVSTACLNGMLAYSSELSFWRRHEWENICYGESGLQALGAVLYAGMITFSGIAVHRYRKEQVQKTAEVHVKLDDLGSNGV